jgi:hypothetical protein
MTPAEYDAHCRVWRKREQRRQGRFAMLALVAAKCAGNADRTMDDFMGDLAGDEEGAE